MTSKVLTCDQSLKKLKRIEKDLEAMWIWSDDGGVWQTDFVKMMREIKRIRRHWETKSGVTAK